ncbi:alpha/beta fold hydrolase [Siccirubricoccus sp. G192]|uniref:alpha/beta fold hydrolase n=1 Tax=Siccirubricoccus sp. G192 TaxID=2849651 RepID=UPI001C2BD0EF|nr:alpha/beta hydrolase [Siccirubricoccus sp. G192]MBV1798808.1 alpha/beta hydrolase [Siccirubricoccus sp. G192]
MQVELPDGASIAVRIEGQGPPLLLVSGLGGTAGFWGRSGALLAARHQVITFDQRGIGASTRGSLPVTVERLAEDVEAVAGALDLGRFALAGHSTGAAIALTLAARGRLPLSGLVLSGGWVRADAYVRALFTLRLEVLRGLDFAGYERFGRFLAYPPAWLVETGDFGPSGSAPGAEEAALQALWAERIGALLAYDGTPLLGAAGAPVLVIGAMDDAIIPHHHQREMAARIPGARLHALPDGGHFFPITRADAFAAAVLEFLGG